MAAHPSDAARQVVKRGASDCRPHCCPHSIGAPSLTQLAAGLIGAAMPRSRMSSGRHAKAAPAAGARQRLSCWTRKYPDPLLWYSNSIMPLADWIILNAIAVLGKRVVQSERAFVDLSAAVITCITSSMVLGAFAFPAATQVS